MKNENVSQESLVVGGTSYDGWANSYKTTIIKKNTIKVVQTIYGETPEKSIENAKFFILGCELSKKYNLEDLEDLMDSIKLLEESHDFKFSDLCDYPPIKKIMMVFNKIRLF